MTSTYLPIKTALLSVSNKQGIIEFAQELAQMGIRLLSTGGTAKLLQEAGLKITEVAEHTGFPEMLDGRVKTLHPAIHGGLLARRELTQHMQAIHEHNIDPIDLLVVNLYPFENTVAKAGCTLEDAIENIDIGGPAMVRSAAKNWRGVGVVTCNAQYAEVLNEIKTQQGLSDTTRFKLAVTAFNHIADYDSAISNYLSAIQPDQTHAAFPGQLNANFVKLQDLRYGENPHQKAAFYRDRTPLPGSLVTAKQLQGKELSYNNIADADAAWECVKSFDAPCCVIIKHANPCGAAIGKDATQAYSLAFKTDSTSAFGGIIAFNTVVDKSAAEQIAKQFVEVLIAPGYTQEALEILAAKKNTRVLQIDIRALQQQNEINWDKSRNTYDLKRVGSGLLIQSADYHQLSVNDLKIVTKAKPSAQQIQDMMFSWKIAQYTKSNAIVFCANGMTLGVGAGQMSRVDSARIASMKAENAGLTLKGSAVASDAFFPFRDGLDVVIQAGASCVIQPGGSIRDQEVIDAADEQGIVMAFTGIRHFRH